MYDKQEVLDQIEKELEDIMPGLRIYMWEMKWDTNTVTAVSVKVPLAGNRSMIEKLEEKGFKAVRRQMRHSIYDGQKQGFDLIMRRVLDA